MSKIKKGGLDQYGAEPFEQQQFGTAVVEGVKCALLTVSVFVMPLPPLTVGDIIFSSWLSVRAAWKCVNTMSCKLLGEI